MSNTPSEVKTEAPAKTSAPATGTAAAQKKGKQKSKAAKGAKGRRPATKGAPAGKGKKVPRKVTVKYTIDCTHPVQDGIMDPHAFEKFLHDTIKVNGKAGMLGNAVKITREQTKIHVTAQAPFSKRYLKYLTKKYLKKHSLRDWLRVVAANKQTYELRYFNIHEQSDEEEEEAAD